MKKRVFLSANVLLSVFLSCTDIEKENSVTIFAAASTTDLVSDMAASYEEDTGIKVKINAASSGTLAKQLEQGAEADIYISASLEWMKYVQSLGLSEIDQPFLRNRLVLIAHRDSPLEPFVLDSTFNLPRLFSSRFSLGDPAHVPAGRYAVEALKSLDYYDALYNRMLPAADARGALSVVEFDEAELGIVYETDALKSSKVKIISFFPEDSYSPVLYLCALLDTSTPPGRKFYNYLISSDQVKDLYLKYGFTSPDA